MSVFPAVVVRVGADPAPNEYPPAVEVQVTVLVPVPSWVSMKSIRCPSTGLDGTPMVRFPPRVTRKSLPSAAFTAMVAASVSAAGVTAIAPVNVAPASRAYKLPALTQVPGVPPAVQTKIRPVTSTTKSPVANVPDPGAPDAVPPANLVAVV